MLIMFIDSSFELRIMHYFANMMIDKIRMIRILSCVNGTNIPICTQEKWPRLSPRISDLDVFAIIHKKKINPFLFKRQIRTKSHFNQISRFFGCEFTFLMHNCVNIYLCVWLHLKFDQCNYVFLLLFHSF